jgi:hypothetical protein
MTTSSSVLACARCGTGNHLASRFCSSCDLPLGSVQPDAGAGNDALDDYEAPEPADPDTASILREFIQRTGLESSPSRHGWRVVLPMRLDRRQVVYLGHSGVDAEGRPILSLVSVCGPANERDARLLLKLNARFVEGHFAVKVLRGEEYFVVIHNLVASTAADIDALGLVRRIAEIADGLEDRLSRGRDIY